jgi:hypothetical protein
LNQPPRHRPLRPQRAQFPSLHWYSSRVRNSASRGQHPSFPHRCTRPLLVSWRLAGTLRPQLRHDAITRTIVIISDRVQGNYLMDYFSILHLLSMPWGFLWSAPIHYSTSTSIGPFWNHWFIVYTCPRTTAVKTPFDIVYAS